MKKKIAFILSLIIILLAFQVNADVVTRIKDIARIKGIRKNQLVGYGLVIGLAGTGDSSTAAAAKSLTNFLDSFGVNIDPSQMKGKNVAAVCITATLPAFAQKGDQIDVLVSSIGDAKSLKNGVLLISPLKAANDQIYAVAQGPLSIGGGDSEGKTKSHLTIGRIPGGAIIERIVSCNYISDNNTFEIDLQNGDFTTATSIAEQINLYFNDFLAQVKSPSSIEVFIPEDFQKHVMLYISRIEQLPITPDTGAKIIINERTGTVLMGGPIKIAPVAVAHGGLNVTIKAAESNEENSGVGLTIENVAKGKFIEMAPGNSISDVIRILNVIGASSQDMIAILQAMKNAGALQAELEII